MPRQALLYCECPCSICEGRYRTAIQKLGLLIAGDEKYHVDTAAATRTRISFRYLIYRFGRRTFATGVHPDLPLFICTLSAMKTNIQIDILFTLKMIPLPSIHSKH